MSWITKIPISLTLLVLLVIYFFASGQLAF